MATEYSMSIDDTLDSTPHEMFILAEARTMLKDRFATFHTLLHQRESELLAELEQLEENNRDYLNHVRNDLAKVRGVVESLDDSLGTNTLKVFLETQKTIWREQIVEMERSEKLLSHVKLNFLDYGTFARNPFEFVPFWSKTKFRTELSSYLELEPALEECWYLVSQEWFSQFSNSINLSDPQPNDSWEFPEKIPMQTGCIPGNSKLLHSKAWDVLLAFNDLAPGCIPIKRQTYYNDVTKKIEVPIHRTKHKCIIRHKDEKSDLSLNCEIETFPNETYQDVVQRFSVFDQLFPYFPIVYSSNKDFTITESKNVGYSWYGNKQYSNSSKPLDVTNVPVGVSPKVILLILPDPKRMHSFRVV